MLALFGSCERWCWRDEEPSTLQRSVSNPLTSLLPHRSGRWRLHIAKDDFSSDPVCDGEPGNCKAISGTSKTEKLGHKAAFSDSGMEYKPETRTSSSGLHLAARQSWTS